MNSSLKTFISRILFLFLVLFPALGIACDCPDSVSAAVAFEKADIAFSGKVVNINTNWMSGGWKITFSVSETWKRQADKLLILETDWEKDCGFMFEPGKAYLVYAEKPYTFKTAKCSGTKLLGYATDDLAFLGEGNPPVVSGMVGSMGVLLIVLAIASLVFVAFIVLRKKLLKRS